jgi:hypothetical protein
MNPYLYVLNNPLRYVDLMGLTPSEVAGGGSFASEIVRELERTGQYPGGWGSQELHSFAHRYDEELQWIARHEWNASELAFLSDKTLAFEVPLGERIELQRRLNRGDGLDEIRSYFSEAVFCLQDRGGWFLGIISWDAYEAYLASQSGMSSHDWQNQMMMFSIIQGALLTDQFHAAGSYRLARDIDMTSERDWRNNFRSARRVQQNLGDHIEFGSDTKSTQKLIDQMDQRGWTESSVRNTVNNPHTTRVSTNMATGNSATVYYNRSGGYVIIDNITNAVVQVGDNINPITWIPDPRIINPFIPK